MSSTEATDAHDERYLKGIEYFNDCETLNIPGFVYPVREHFLEDVLEMTQFDSDGKVCRSDNAKQTIGKNVDVLDMSDEELRKKKMYNYDRLLDLYVDQLRKKRLYSEGTLKSLKDQTCEDLDF